MDRYIAIDVYALYISYIYWAVHFENSVPASDHQRAFFKDVGLLLKQNCRSRILKGLFGHMLLSHLSEVDKQYILDNKW